MTSQSLLFQALDDAESQETLKTWRLERNVLRSVTVTTLTVHAITL